MELKIYSTKFDAARHFSEYLKILIQSRASVHIALSGGSTPKVVFDELATNYSDEIDWSKVHLYWGDERCVAPTHGDSNYGMTVDHLLSKIDIPKKNIHRIHGENGPEDEAIRYGRILEKELPNDNDTPQFDLVILGLGDDGHTASIFPHEIALWYSKENCEVATHPDSGQKRITITGKLINNAKKVAFLVTGGNKSQKVKEIINHEGGYEAYPATLVSPVSGKLIWFLDREAAKELTAAQS
ncbi:MAG: 6-phosphogluconolactonase [Maribacter sp.]|uniref:6-phosphogluconolactonase n=1 Tax=Maribacter sp. TaxID=1897614 RepID=UPI003C70A902